MKPKIAVFLPVVVTGESLRNSLNIIHMLCMRAEKENFEIIFSCVEGGHNIPKDFHEILKYNISIRESKWIPVFKNDVKISLEYMQIKKSLDFDTYFLPTDGIKNFMDCDFWLLLSDHIEYPLVPIKPYGVVVFDYTQRYISEYLHENDLPYIKTVRSANVVLCTTPKTLEDTLQYAGVKKEKCKIIPFTYNIYDLKIEKELIIKDDYFIWYTDYRKNTNHLLVLDALERYFEQLNGMLKIIIIDSHENKYIRKEILSKKRKVFILYKNEIIKTIKNNKILKDNVIICENLTTDTYISILASSKFLFYPTLYNNGTLAVIDAFCHNVPIIANRYPQLKYIDNKLNLNIHFFNALDYFDVAKSVKSAEENYCDLQIISDRKKSLETLSPENNSEYFWKILREYL